jgi:hypothetical protein
VRLVRETETTQQDIHDWHELDEADPEFQCLVFFIVFRGCTAIFLNLILSLLSVEYSICMSLCLYVVYFFVS